jgi:hypothetical protein
MRSQPKVLPVEEDPFAEQALRPVLRVQDKILEALRKQLSSGLISLADYEKAASNAVAVLSEEEAAAAALPGHTMRIVFSNERRQFESGLLSEAEFARLKKAAVLSKSSSGASSPRGSAASPRLTGSGSPRANVESPRKASPRRPPPPPPPPPPPSVPAPLPPSVSEAYVPFAPRKAVAQVCSLFLPLFFCSSDQKTGSRCHSSGNQRRHFFEFVVLCCGNDSSGASQLSWSVQAKTCVSFACSRS